MLRRNLLGIWCALPVIMLCACERVSPTRAVDPLEFTRPGDNLALAFDLRQDSDPLAAVVVNRAAAPAGQAQTLVLPFTSQRPNNDLELASATGHYNNLTVMSFVYGGTGVGAITVVPIFSLAPKAPYDLTQLDGPIYLIRSGLQRDFLFRYGSDLALDHIRPPHLRPLAKTAFDSIVVALPFDAKGREINSGRTAVPSHTSENSTARFYPASAPSQNIRVLHIRYELPATSEQKAVADALLSFGSVVVIPLIGFILMAPGDIRRPGIRKLIIILAVILQFGIILWLSIIAWHSYDSLEVPFFINATAALVGAVFSGVALWIKR